LRATILVAIVRRIVESGVDYFRRPHMQTATHRRQTQVTLPELALIGGTRALIGGGLGLLLADRVAPAPRRAIGWTLLAVGALTTIPLAFEVLGSDHAPSPATVEHPAPASAPVA